MEHVDRLTEHERAATDSAEEAKSLTLADCFVGRAASAEGAVEPDATNSVCAALANQLDRHGRVGGNHDTVEGPRNGADIRITPHAFGFGGVRIHREGLAPGVPELAIDSIGRLPRIARHASDGDTLPL
jgi:hypothetical protein